MSTSTFMGNSDGPVSGLCPAPPPPPPPPPAPGQVPAMRINTAEAPTIRRPMVSNDAYEPPAAIQNAMLTKDKKPFTYTPGMGGKLDLSQIRSPRMARRVAKNANDEGIEGPPKSALEPKPTPATNASANLFVQPQVAIPVFPTNVPPQPPLNRTPPPATKIQPTIVPEKQPESPKAKVETKVTPVITIQPNTPESPGTPTQVTLAKAPTPWLQNKNKPQEELPEWAKRSSKSPSSSPDSPTSPPIQQMQPQWQQAQQKQQPIQQRPQSMPQQQRQDQQPQFNQKRPQSQTQERVIPIRIEDRPSVFDVKPEAGHHQFKQPSPHHQQRWGQPAQNQNRNQAQNQNFNQAQNQNWNQPQNQNWNQAQNQVQNQVPQASQPQQSGGGYIIPIMVEGNERKPGANSYSQPIRNSTPNAENQTGKVQRIIPVQVQEPGPVQSRSFRVLQKITDTDNANDVDTDQMRKLQLTEDDRILMNKFKEQVDNDSSLHHEEDPRYRGAAIPSRAFRFLQTMTDAGEVPVINASQRPPSAINRKQNRNSKTFEESQANLPPSEQQVQEPKKYMGSAIPSRSFRILQAMTAPESVATQENRQADFRCQTENNVPGNQQGVFLSYPPFLPPENVCWGYYPLPYPGVVNNYHPDTAYVYFPIYNQNPPQYNPMNNKNVCCQPYVVPVSSPSGSNCGQSHGQISDNATVPGTEPVINFSEGIQDNGLEDKQIGDNVGDDRQWENNSVSRTDSNNSKDSDCTTAMNITDEEEIPEGIEEQSEKACAGLNVTVPNYTYIDTSDSSDSSDTESQSDNDDSVKSSSDNSDEDSSDSDDSDSYLAYSTGLNPHGRLVNDNESQSCNDENNSDSEPGSKTCETDNGDQLKKESSEVNQFPHQLSVIYEDAERDLESPRPSNTPFEATDDPPDDSDTPTVSVSLPLRFKFSVSENNEDVTTVIVGDSTIKPERGYVKDESKNTLGKAIKSEKVKEENQVKVQDSKNTLESTDKSTDKNDTSVDFIVQKDESKRKRKNSNERLKEEMKLDDDVVVPCVNFTLRKIPTRYSKINYEETVETEFTIKRKSRTNKEKEANDESETRDINRNILKPEVIVSEYNQNSDSKIKNNEFEESVDVSKKSKKEEETKHLLNVQNSREETDDEDSGVTSDMSRMISEVDTDSECTSSKNMKKYQRTQTHSRLFRLLNDDSILQEEKTNDCSAGREYLSLPLKTTFNYDENYFSNHSSGVTSPEFSPVHEQSENQNGHPLTRQDRVSCKEDPYYQAWKMPKCPTSDQDVVPSLAFKVLENRRPLWSYRVNVLCPRIKSTKSVPRALGEKTDPAPCHPPSLNTDHC